MLDTGCPQLPASSIQHPAFQRASSIQYPASSIQQASSFRAIRIVAWGILLALAVFQGYAARFAVGPDGISYLDLSDAVVTGHWSGLVNLYWSPLYPALIGLARAGLGVGPVSEIPLVHALNVVWFAGLLASFEYVLTSILVLAAVTRHSALGGKWGLVGAYVLFGCFAFTMIPLELTTPDLLSGAAIFVAFGALLRLRHASPHTTRDAIVLGVALGVGMLAKSFLAPWAVVCFATLALATRTRGLRTTVISVVAWAVFAGPWIALLSHTAGRLTVGDTGRLTYIWYVNEQDPPSLGGVPPGARTVSTESVLPGVGATGPAPGTDPMWYDPARWNAQLAPHWNARQQLGALRVFQLFYVQNLTPLLFIALLIAAASRGTRRYAWWNGWVVYLPALAGITAYAMVLVTARYIMPFVLTGTLVLLATLPLPRRMLPLLAFFGIVIPVGLEAMSSQTVLGLALVASVIGGMIVGVLVPPRSPLIWSTLVFAGLALTRILLPSLAPGVLHLGAAALTFVFWWTARRAIRNRRPVQFARRAEAALGLLLAFVLLLRLGLRFDQDVGAMRLAASDASGNVPLRIAQDLASRGVVPGTRIAIIGPHAESYWARSGRLNIVADVPRIRVQAFWELPPAARDSLLDAFSAAGATVAIASIGPATGQPDSTWKPVRFQTWLRPLPHRVP